jgi:hypothetical protein
MPQLNLLSTTDEENLIKQYLEENASDILTQKINQGVSVFKDGKELTNKKTLQGFMKFASEEARKQTVKGATSACIQDSVVYGWAMHYFEEDSIVEKLYTSDGKEYAPAVKTVPSAPAVKSVTSSSNKQFSLFDSPPKEQEEVITEEDWAEACNDCMVENADQFSQDVPPMPEFKDEEPLPDTSAYTTSALAELYALFGDDIATV